MSTFPRRFAINGGRPHLSLPRPHTGIVAPCPTRLFATARGPKLKDTKALKRVRDTPQARSPPSDDATSKRPVHQRILDSIFRRTVSPASEPRRSWLRSHDFKYIAFWLSFASIAHFFMTRIYTVSGTWGSSMLPTMYLSGEWVLIKKSHRLGRNIQVGDVICARSPLHPADVVIKRVVGMPGDLVCVWSADVFADGRDGATWGKGEPRMVRVPMGHCWLAGDNLEFSRDSRHYGPVPLALVLGKVTHRIWPWTRIGEFENTLREVEEESLPAA